MLVDMHFHSTNSDWYLSREELVKKSIERDLSFIALTDHDKVSDDFIEIASNSWLKTTRSVEISANNNGKSTHITLYAREIWYEIRNILKNTITQKQLLIEKQLDRLIDIWFIIDKNDFYKYFEKINRDKNSINKLDIAFYIYLNPVNIELVNKISNHSVGNFRELYQKYLRLSSEKFNELWVIFPPYEADLDLLSKYLTNTKQVVSIPHANWTFKKEGIEWFKRILPNYIEKWINALEINAQMTKDWVEQILQLSNKYNLYLTFWSDFHKPGSKDWLHWDLWDQNIYIEREFIKKSVYKYLDMISTNK